jgi:outer membrane protein TolC
MDAAERHDHGVEMSQASVQEADSRGRQTRGQMGPKVALEGNAVWFDKDVNELTGVTLPNGTTIPERVRTGAVVVSQPLLGLGPLWLKAEAETLNREIAVSDRTAASQEARLHGADAFIRTLKAQRFLQITRSSLAVIEQQRRDAVALNRQGKLADADILRFDFAQSDAKTQLMQAQAGAAVAAVALVEALGLPRDTRRLELEAAPAAGLQGGAPPRDLPPLARLLATGTSRPDLRAAGDRVAAATYSLRASGYDYAPSLNAFARYERDFEAEDLAVPGPDGAADYDKDDIRDRFSYGLTASWTIWDWGTRRHRSAEYAATVAKTRAAEEAARSKAHVEITQAYMELRYAVEALESSRVSARLGR